MSQVEVSCIVPYCNEGSNVIFTAQSLREELDGFCKYEIILIDNMSHDHLMVRPGNGVPKTLPNMTPEEIRACADEREYWLYSRDFFYHPAKGTPPEQWGDQSKWATIDTMFFRKGVMKYLRYDAKQGHWNAKNHGIANSTGKYLFFVDAHCIMGRDSLRRMIQFLRDTEGREFQNGPVKYKVGAVHAYINYMLDSRSLEYKPQGKTFGYQFSTHQVGSTPGSFPDKPYQVCVMSTCGMLCPRSVIDELGAWNPEFGIYGGGEGYMNWKQSTCGYGHWIHPQAQCWHLADKRGYVWNHTDFVRNSFIAAYVVGGDEFLNQQVEERLKKDRPGTILALAEDVRTKCQADRDFVAGKQVISYGDYIDWWLAHPGTWK